MNCFALLQILIERTLKERELFAPGKMQVAKETWKMGNYILPFICTNGKWQWVMFCNTFLFPTFIAHTFPDNFNN